MAWDSKKALAENAHLVLIDESGFLTMPLVRRSLARRGQTPIFRHKGSKREKVSVIAALSLSPKTRRLGLYFKALPKQAFTSELIQHFLSDLLRHLRGRVIVVWDNAMIHRGPAIREFLQRNHRLHLEALPPYAPELNPVEQLWTWLKWSKFANDARDDANSINRSLCPTLRACRHKQNRLASFFGGSALPFPDPSLEI